ncbi:MAG: DUF983 domain-containing protein [bacterium]
MHHENGLGERGTIAAILTLRCPVCHEGKVFGNLLLRMHADCPVCGLKFEREPGYFLGAMYFSYAMAIPPLTIMTLLFKYFLPAWPMHFCIAAATCVFLPLVVPIVRYSRVMWLHFDRFFDPQEKPEPDN